jgi:hypothetical protein
MAARCAGMWTKAVDPGIDRHQSLFRFGGMHGVAVLLSMRNLGLILRSVHSRASRRMKPPTWKMLAMSDLLALR